MRRTEELTESERVNLAAGRHVEVARALGDRSRHDLAALILEEIWDFDGAVDAYLRAEQPIPALTAALSAENSDLLNRVIDWVIATNDADARMAAARTLRDRGRHTDAVRLLEAEQAPTSVLADTLGDAGDDVAAAQAWAEGGEPGRALALLVDSGRDDPARWRLEARLHWDLGDAHGVARSAQRAFRAGAQDRTTAELLARSLVALGHDVAAQLVAPIDMDPSAAPLRGRYRVTAPLPASLAGAAYEGVDRVTLREVEVHLLLAEHPGTPDDARLQEALRRFAKAARRGANVGHPAIRRINEIDADAGLLVLPRADGPPLRQVIRPPGISPARARSMIAFLLEGIVAAGHHGLAHGAILPSQLVCDRVGRPLLGPFGTYWLRGLVATRTGSLEEVVHATAPELRRGAPPTIEGDVHALGALWAALLGGRLGADTPSGADGDGIRSMLAHDLSQRPDPSELLLRLRRPVADVSKLGAGRMAGAGGSEGETSTEPHSEGVRIVIQDGWDDETLGQICSARDPWLQPILDRNGRVLVLAPWPSGCRTVPDTTPGWRDLIPEQALASLPQPARGEVERRLRPSSLVTTPGGAWMLALDDLLTR